MFGVTLFSFLLNRQRKPLSRHAYFYFAVSFVSFISCIKFGLLKLEKFQHPCPFRNRIHLESFRHSAYFTQNWGMEIKFGGEARWVQFSTFFQILIKRYYHVILFSKWLYLPVVLTFLTLYKSMLGIIIKWFRGWKNRKNGKWPPCN